MIVANLLVIHIYHETNEEDIDIFKDTRNTIVKMESVTRVKQIHK